MVVVRELITKFSFQVNSEAVKSFVAMLNEAESKLDGLGKKTTIKVADVKLQKQAVQLKTQELKMEGQALKNQGLKLKGDAQALKNQGLKLKADGVALKNQGLKLKGDAQALKNDVVKLRLQKLATSINEQAQKRQEREDKKAEARRKDIQKRWDDRRNKRYTEEQRYQQWLERGSIGQRDRTLRMFPSMKLNRTGSEDLVSHARKVKLDLFKNQSLQPTPTGGGSGFSLADTYFNVQLLKDAYQLFYNIAEATRQTAVNILRANDGLNMSIAKIGVITGDTKNASKNFKELLDISAQTGSEIGVIEEIFNRLSMGKQGLGATTEQITQFTGAMAKLSAFSEGGAAQQGALRQLGQMFGGAYIQAQEWNSIVDGLPAVATKIAKAMGTTREAMTFKIRQQTKDSPAYLIKDIFPRFLKILPEIDAEFNKLPPTLDRTLNKAGVGLLKFSLNLKESVKMPELDSFYSNLDKAVAKVFEWADANKALIGTNINIFFKNLNDLLAWFMAEISKPEDINIFTKALKDTKDVLKSINTALKDSKPIADTLTSPAGILALGLMKQTLESLISPLTLIASLVSTIGSGFNAINDFNVNNTVNSLRDRRKLGATTDQLRSEGYSNSILGKAGLLGTPIIYPKQLGGGSVTNISQKITVQGGTGTPAQQKQAGQNIANHARVAIQKGSVGH